MQFFRKKADFAEKYSFGVRFWVKIQSATEYYNAQNKIRIKRNFVLKIIQSF